MEPIRKRLGEFYLKGEDLKGGEEVVLIALIEETVENTPVYKIEVDNLLWATCELSQPACLIYKILKDHLEEYGTLTKSPE